MEILDGFTLLAEKARILYFAGFLQPVNGGRDVQAPPFLGKGRGEVRTGPMTGPQGGIHSLHGWTILSTVGNDPKRSLRRRKLPFQTAERTESALLATGEQFMCRPYSTSSSSSPTSATSSSSSASSSGIPACWNSASKGLGPVGGWPSPS